MNTLSESIIEAPVSPKRRRHFRVHCFKDAIVTAGHARIRSRVINASPAGIFLEIDKSHPLEIGSTVMVDWAAPKELKGSSVSDRCVIPGTVVRLGASTHAAQTYSIKFRRLVQEQMLLRTSRKQKIIVAGIAALLAGVIGMLKVHNFVYFWYDPLLEIYSIGAATFVASRIAISFFYKEPADRGYFPTVSIIIAAKNEEAHIGQTIEHCFRSNYPPDLFDVFAVDDGSTDGTWDIMKKLEEKNTRMTAFRFDKNKGKRHAMALGAQEAKGDILVYVDSDSYIDPDSLYRIVQPFAEKNVGAVSGHVLAAIEPDNFISKMEAVRYYVSHRIMKAAESVFGTVTCCPGAFSAYRRSAVVEAVPAWLNQKFMGTSATFGDDRSLTNYILRKFDVVYHSGALCVTYVPRTLFQFFRQQLRWKKSWSRETTVAARIMIRKHPVAALFYYLGIVVTLLSPLVALRSLVLVPLMTSASFGPYLLGVLLVGLFLCLIYRYYTQSAYWYYGLAFAALYIFVLSFQNYYAIATVRKNHWGTR